MFFTKSPKVGGGLVVQYRETATGEVATGTTTIPFDDTIPQSNEGNQYLTVDITPKAVGNELFISVTLEAAHSVADTNIAAALFKDTDSNALAVGYVNVPNANREHIIKFDYRMTTTSTSLITFKVRAGGHNAGTMTLNGVIGARYYAGKLQSRIRVVELSPNT